MSLSTFILRLSAFFELRPVTLVAFLMFFISNLNAQVDRTLLKSLFELGYIQDSTISSNEGTSWCHDSVLSCYNVSLNTSFDIKVRGRWITILEGYSMESQTGIAANYSTILLLDSTKTSKIESYFGLRGVVTKGDSTFLVLGEVNITFRDIQNCCRVLHLSFYNVESSTKNQISGPYFFECDNPIFDGFYDIDSPIEINEENIVLYKGYGCYE